MEHQLGAVEFWPEVYLAEITERPHCHYKIAVVLRLEAVDVAVHNKQTPLDIPRKDVPKTLDFLDLLRGHLHLDSSHWKVYGSMFLQFGSFHDMLFDWWHYTVRLLRWLGTLQNPLLTCYGIEFQWLSILLVIVLRCTRFQLNDYAFRFSWRLGAAVSAECFGNHPA